MLSTALCRLPGLGAQCQCDSLPCALQEMMLYPGCQSECSQLIAVTGLSRAFRSNCGTPRLCPALQKVVPSSPPDVTQELANRADEVYSGAVDGIDSSELGTVVEELEAGAEALRVRHKGLSRS